MQHYGGWELRSEDLSQLSVPPCINGDVEITKLIL